MTRRPTDQETPLEQTLLNLPQEAAPAGLQDSCLAALDGAKVTKPARRPVPWNQFAIAAAASILIAIIALPLLSPPAKRAAAPSQHVAFGPGGGPGAAGGGPGPAMPVSGVQRKEEMRKPSPAQGLAHPKPSYQAALDKTARRPTAAPGAPGGPGGGNDLEQATAPPAAPPAAAGPAPVRGRGVMGTSYNGEAADRVATTAGAKTETQSPEPIAPQHVDAGAPAAPAPVLPPGTAGYPPRPTTPWYDQSEQRQKITHRDMALETPDVERVYHEAVTIIEKAHGYVANENLTVEDRGPDKAVIEARVPADGFDGVVGQLRDLGKLVKLTGTSEDRTIEYRSRGADIRGLSFAEQKLVERYEREENPSRKAAIKLELDELRRNLHQEKTALLELAAEASYAYLNIEITEHGHFWKTVKEGAAEALPIAMALALVALPFFVVALIWRRRG